jgi:CheY-like chemotaxis protein
VRSKKKASSPSLGTVLLVENDRVAFDGTAGLLRRAGFGVVHATTAVDALDVARGAREIDLLIATVAIPGQPSGFTIARMARLRRPELPVLYIGRQEEIDAKETERALGPVLSPPVDKDRLVEAITTALRPKSS